MTKPFTPLHLLQSLLFSPSCWVVFGHALCSFTLYAGSSFLASRNRRDRIGSFIQQTAKSTGFFPCHCFLAFLVILFFSFLASSPCLAGSQHKDQAKKREGELKTSQGEVNKGRPEGRNWLNRIRLSYFLIHSSDFAFRPCLSSLPVVCSSWSSSFLATLWCPSLLRVCVHVMFSLSDPFRLFSFFLCCPVLPLLIRSSFSVSSSFPCSFFWSFLSAPLLLSFSFSICLVFVFFPSLPCGCCLGTSLSLNRHNSCSSISSLSFRFAFLFCFSDRHWFFSSLIFSLWWREVWDCFACSAPCLWSSE